MQFSGWGATTRGPFAWGRYLTPTTPPTFQREAWCIKKVHSEGGVLYKGEVPNTKMYYSGANFKIKNLSKGIVLLCIAPKFIKNPQGWLSRMARRAGHGEFEVGCLVHVSPSTEDDDVRGCL